MFEFLKNRAINASLAWLKERIMHEYLEGIGIISELIWKDGRMHVQLILHGLENQPIDITVTDMEIAPDASSISINAYEANMPFVEVALNRFAARTFAIPEGPGRLALLAAKKALNIY